MRRPALRGAKFIPAELKTPEPLCFAGQGPTINLTCSAGRCIHVSPREDPTDVQNHPKIVTVTDILYFQRAGATKGSNRPK